MQKCIIPFADAIVVADGIVFAVAIAGFLIFVNKAQNWTEKIHDQREKYRRGR